MAKLSRDVVVSRLREIQNLKAGERLPPWCGGFAHWGEPISQLCGAAADYLEDEFPIKE